MPTLLEGAAPPPHLQLATQPWPPYNPHGYPSTSSPAPMTPDSMSSFVPRLHDSPLPQAEASPVPTSGWYTTSVGADSPQQASYSAYAYNQSYVPSSAGPYSPHPHMSAAPNLSVNAPASIEHPTGNYSPVSNSSKASDAKVAEYVQQSRAPSPDTAAANHLALDMPLNRQRSSTTEYHWHMNPLGISNSAMPQHFYPSPTFPNARDRSPCMSEPSMELSATQARRLYAPIAPHPSGARTSAPKRSREDDDDEQSEQGKRRKRSDSNTSSTMELGEEDRLLIQLKDEDCMPWKDIAARFQSDLGKTYQIPALQMRLKRLRERMRVWTDVDVKALRMAHEYWVQSKFDIIAQKMLEYGAAEKWTARQCARKWADVDPGPTPYTTYEHHVYSPYAVSPVEPHHFMPYVHIQ